LRLPGLSRRNVTQMAHTDLGQRKPQQHSPHKRNAAEQVIKDPTRRVLCSAGNYCTFTFIQRDWIAPMSCSTTTRIFWLPLPNRTTWKLQSPLEETVR
jgi:hypothetical protein